MHPSFVAQLLVNSPQAKQQGRKSLCNQIRDLGSELTKIIASDSKKRQASDGFLVRCTPTYQEGYEGKMRTRSRTDSVVLQICVLFGQRVHIGILHGLQGGTVFVSD